MYELIVMGVALGLFVVLLRLKLKIGLSMILAACVLELLLGVSPFRLWGEFIQEWRDKPLSQTTGYLFVTLASMLTFVNILGLAMKETGVSGKLTEALLVLFKSRRGAMVGIPMLMGLLPTPGGIMLSAPMVRDLADSIGVTRSRSAAINFFFRHQWEMVWPLFPSIPLIQGMLGISAIALIKHNIVISICGITGGIIFLLLSGIPPKKGQRDKAKWLHSLHVFIQAFWPIGLVAGLHAALNVNPAIGILISITLFMLVYRVPFGRCGHLCREGFEIDLILLILGALLFKLNLQAAGSIAAVVQFFADIHMPGMVLLFVLPMLVAALTGLTMPTVAITFPLLMPYIVTGAGVDIGLQTLAFSGLLCGLYLTPVHLCLSLSASYFEAPLGRIILLLIGPIACIAVGGILAAKVL